MEGPAHLRELIDANFEWLAVRENGRTLPLRSDEIELSGDGSRVMFGFVDETGFAVRRICRMETDGKEIGLRLSGKFRTDFETVRLVPRESAAALSANIEIARLETANETAKSLAESFDGIRLLRVALNTANGRLAQIMIADQTGRKIGVVTDVTRSLTNENLLAAGIKWLDELRSRRRDPIGEVWIAAVKRQARGLQKLHGLLNSGARAGIRIVEIDPSTDPKAAAAKMLRHFPLSEMWRERPKKLSLPPIVEPGETAGAIVAVAPDNVDVVFNRQGETLRFRGLPFARVRKVLGKERGWFGIEKSRRPLSRSTWPAMLELVADLEKYRSPSPPARRHELFRLATEAWLGSILRRNINLLDTNLILAPIYNQFRSSSDKIDLLAIRRDGRLVIIELKASPDRDAVFQAADYWRKIELQRRRGILAEADLFAGRTIADEPALVYVVAPALSFHRDFEYFARMLSSEIELWRWELHENWRSEVRVLARKNYSGIC
jgi:hypothetical protein